MSRGTWINPASAGQGLQRCVREVLDVVDQLPGVLGETSADQRLVDALRRVHDAVDALLRCEVEHGTERVRRSLDVACGHARDGEVGLGAGFIAESPRRV